MLLALTSPLSALLGGEAEAAMRLPCPVPANWGSRPMKKPAIFGPES